MPSSPTSNSKHNEKFPDKSQIPPCSRCGIDLICIERIDDGDIIKFNYICPIHNNKNNPVMKIFLGENHEFFREPYKEIVS